VKATRRDPCKTCGHFLIEHEGEVFDVRCGYCALTPPPTTEWRRAPKTVCTNCYLIVGGLIGSLLTLGVLWLR
jgi:hypothetical protein